MKAFRVNISSLTHRDHHFDFKFGDEFLAAYGNDIISKGQFSASVTLDKHETFIEASFKINGEARLECDRSLEPYDEPLDIDQQIVFKYGNEEAELSDEIVLISRERDSLDLGQYMYEFIVLAIPMKRLHPKYRQHEEDDEDGKMIYTSEAGKVDEEIDPRWEILKKLK